jgi:hypothetical protein
MNFKDFNKHYKFQKMNLKQLNINYKMLNNLFSLISHCLLSLNNKKTSLKID